MKKIYPNLLSKGDTIGVAALTWKPDPSKVYESEAILNSIGFEVDVHENVYLEDGQMAGTEQQRLQAFNELMMDDVINGIIFARGGYGCTQLLSYLDYDLIAEKAKYIQGYSDLTALLNAIYAKTDLITYHGPMVGTNNVQFSDELTREQFLSMSAGLSTEVSLSPCASVTLGASQGTLIGGNMTLMDHLIGTSYFPPDDQVILLLEDVGEKINELDKFCFHLEHAGLKPRVQGVIFGESADWDDNDEPFGYSLKEILQKHFPDVPCVMDVKVGHGQTILTMPIGATVRLEVNDIQPKLVTLDE